MNIEKTPHIVLKPNMSFTKTVLMPGDPKRAEMIAEKYLKDTEIISDVRGIKAIRGKYISRISGNTYDVTVMASGMGMPSMGIYSHELFNFFGVENIIRIGSAGGISTKLKLGDMVISQGACTNSNYFSQYQLNGGTYSAISDYGILKSLVDVATEKKLPVNVMVGNILSSDTFYGYSNVDWGKLGVLATEMESAALFAEAALAGKKAGSICTISDLIFDQSQEMTAEERQNNLRNMIEIALDSVERFE
jgi:purine-nucleoside phosphorylase